MDYVLVFFESIRVMRKHIAQLFCQIKEIKIISYKKTLKSNKGILLYKRVYVYYYWH